MRFGKAELAKPKEEQINRYAPSTSHSAPEEINEKIVEMLRPEGMTTLTIQLVFQSIEGCARRFQTTRVTGISPVIIQPPGGTKLCNQSFVNYIENVYHK